MKTRSSETNNHLEGQANGKRLVSPMIAKSLQPSVGVLLSLSLCPVPVLAELSPVTEALRVIESDGEARESTSGLSGRIQVIATRTLAAGQLTL